MIVALGFDLMVAHSLRGDIGRYRRSSIAFSILLLASAASGQAPPEPGGHAFEVVSVKQNKSGDRRSGITPMKGERFLATNVTVRQLIQFGYRLQDFQIVDAPNWTKTKRYDIEARVPPGTLADQVAGMVRSLLGERFGLQGRMTHRNLPVYLLVPGKAGPKIRDARPCAQPSPDNPCFGIAIEPEGRLTARTIEMKQLVANLGFLLNRPVLDHTGLTGKYDLDLQWRPDGVTTPFEGPQSAPAGSDLPDIFSALDQQLGLKLKSGKARVSVLQISFIVEPGEN